MKAKTLDKPFEIVYNDFRQDGGTLTQKEGMMKTENFESRISNGGGDVVLRTNGHEIWLSVEGDDGRGFTAYLPPRKVFELKGAIANLERMLNEGEFD